MLGGSCVPGGYGGNRGDDGDCDGNADGDDHCDVNGGGGCCDRHGRDYNGDVGRKHHGARLVF